MDVGFYEERNGLYRLKIPFDDLYTSVFLIRTEKGNALIDCATYESDVDEYIVVALKKMKLLLTDITYLVLTHNHEDHIGGLKRILEYHPNIEVVQDFHPICLEGIIVYAMKGHTKNCIGVLDERSGTLISGDGLQGYGIGKYRCSLESREDYLETIEKIKRDKRIKNILFSHAYEPWNKDFAFGCEEVMKCLQDCLEYIKKGD